MKTTILLTQLLLNFETLQAFSPSISRGSLTRTTVPSTRVFSQWDEEEEEKPANPNTFDEAVIAMKEEDEQKALEGMGDYDTNEDVSASANDSIRIQFHSC